MNNYLPSLMLCWSCDFSGLSPSYSFTKCVPNVQTDYFTDTALRNYYCPNSALLHFQFRFVI